MIRNDLGPRFLSFLLLATSLGTNPLLATDCSSLDPLRSISEGSTFNLSSSSFTVAELTSSIGYWRSCSMYGVTLPEISVGGSGGIPVSVTKVAGRSPANCGQTLVYPTQTGQVNRAEITIWSQQSNGTTCAPLTDVLAHELGHVFGLADAAAGVACRGHIMGDRLSGATRAVAADDCDVADAMWTTTEEQWPAYDPYCEAYCWTNCIGSVCPTRPPNMEGCPILFDVEGDGFRLTGLDDPVWFDIDADGETELMSWTDRSEGFLALDRNGNGFIDHGGELFGDHTPVRGGGLASNGYLALADLDTPAMAGNSDGWIDSEDEVFGLLRIWTDGNHNGVSEPRELTSLQDAGITRISLAYKRTHRKDSHGNEFRFMSRAWRVGRRGAEHPVQTWDVFFRVIP